MCWGAIDFLAGNLKPRDRVFEYGSGGSTVFLASLGVQLVSVEHDEEWYKEVSRRLADLAEGTVDYRFVPPGEGECRGSDGYKSAIPLYSKRNFGKYAKTIAEFPNDWFDTLLIDGRVRVDCAKEGLPKVKQGGYVVLDNSKRERYAEIRQLMQDYPKLEFEGTTPRLRYNNVAKPQTTVWTITQKARNVSIARSGEHENTSRSSVSTGK